MKNIVLFLNGEAYEKNIIDSSKNNKFVQVSKRPSNRFISQIFELHNAWAFNKHVELPFKKIWFKNVINYSDLSDNEEMNYLLFFESYRLSYSKKYMMYLKKKVKNVKIVFVFLNPVAHCNHINHKKLLKVQHLYDGVICFDKNDAQKYGYLYYEGGIYSKQNEIDSNVKIESDVFFVGNDKGRYETLMKIYESLTQVGLRCDFNIMNVPLEKRKYTDQINYETILSYDEVVGRIQRTKSILEILPSDYKYMSLRTAEAFFYNKKLLTNNNRIIESEIYDKDIVEIINDDYTPNISFFDSPVDKIKFVNGRYFWSFDRYIDFIKNNV